MSATPLSFPLRTLHLPDTSRAAFDDERTPFLARERGFRDQAGARMSAVNRG
jgi:hypothetical protein